MRVKLLCCEVFSREAYALMAQSPHTIDAEFLPKGLHDLGADRMQPRIQERIDAVPASYDAILMGYGLCNNGLVGIHARQIPLVIPRAHDCITLFMGSRTRYKDYFNANPGTYYRTTGWMERDDPSGAGETTIQQKLGISVQFEELVQKYGEDNARYIMETLGDHTQNYSRLTYIRMGIAGEERFIERAREEARKKGWEFDLVEGSMEILRKLIFGEWDEHFLVLQPGETIQASYTDEVIKLAPSGAPVP